MSDASDEAVYFVIEVTEREGAEITEEDSGVAGTWAVGFLDREAPELDAAQQADELDRLEEHALDLFHERIGISELDDFEIEARRVEGLAAVPEDADLEETTDCYLARRSAARAPGA